MRRRIEVAEPLHIKPVTIGGIDLHTHGWEHVGVLYAYSLEAHVGGPFRAVTLSVRSGQAIAATNYGTRSEAEAKAINEYAAIAYPGAVLSWSWKSQDSD